MRNDDVELEFIDDEEKSSGISISCFNKMFYLVMGATDQYKSSEISVIYGSSKHLELIDTLEKLTQYVKNLWPLEEKE